MRVAPVTVPLIAVAPLVGAAAIRIPDVFGGPLVVVVVGYVAVFVFAVLPHRSGVFAMGWWLIAAATLIPPMLPTVVVPGAGSFRVPTLPAMVAWWVGAALAVGWWIVWLREPVVDAFRSDQPEPVAAPPQARPAAGPLREPAPIGRASMAVDFMPKSDEDAEPESFVDRVAALFPERRRTEKGKVSIKDIAQRFSMTPSDVEVALAEVGVPVAREHGVTPLDGGVGSSMKAVRWAHLTDQPDGGR